MTEISKEKIEIGGVEYTLFLNRKGIVAWEKFCKQKKQKLAELSNKYQDLTNEEEIEITDETDPFAGLEEYEDIDEDTKLVMETYKYLYWVMLYTEHKLNITEASKLFEQACEEYGDEQVLLLAQQMIEDMNSDKVTKTELKNLPALRQKKN